MNVVHQFASATLAAAFSIGLLVSTHLFMEYRSARNPVIATVPPVHPPL